MDSLVNYSGMINPSILKKYTEFWINEDIPNFDLSTIATKNDIISANIEVKEKGILAGLPFAEEVLRYFDCSVEWKYSEGQTIEKSGIIGVIKGLANKVLMAERTVLNILTRACGVATLSNKLNTLVKSKWKGEIAGTRKTTPGFRIVEKYAMYIGGISTHRYDLSSMVMVKDNHVKASGGIEEAVKLLRSKIGKIMKIEVECANLQEALSAAKSGADVVMLDNFSANDVRSVSKQVKNINSSIIVEASGGINETNIMDYAIDSVDIISSSIFSQGYKCIDLSINTVATILSKANSDISESLKTVNNDAKHELIKQDKSDSAASAVPKNDLNVKEKSGIKRKFEETKEVTNDKPNTDATKVAELPVDKLNSSYKSPNKSNSGANNKSQNKFESNKQRKMHSNGKGGQSLYNLQTVGSVRLPGQPVRFGSKGQNGNRANLDPTFIRTMAANLVMSLQNNQSNHTSFMSPSAMRFGGSMTRVPFMSNVKLFCKSCNFQNANNGHPFCQMCRKKLE